MVFLVYSGSLEQKEEDGLKKIDKTMTVKLSNDSKISLVAVICILALAVISKNVLRAQLDFVSLFGPVWVYIAYVVTRDKQKESKTCGSPLFWSLAIIFVTSATIVVYAI